MEFPPNDVMVLKEQQQCTNLILQDEIISPVKLIITLKTIKRCTKVRHIIYQQVYLQQS